MRATTPNRDPRTRLAEPQRPRPLWRWRISSRNLRNLRDWRSRFNAFVARHELAWDLSLAALALVYLLVGFVEDHPLGGWDEARLAPLELSITMIFLLEFTLRLGAAESRRSYLRRHWIDLLALLPSVRVLRFLRLGRLVYLLQAARVLRLGVLVRFVAQLNRASKDFSWIAKHNGVHIFLQVAAALVVFGGVLVWELESPANPSFHNLGDALWWAFATMSTVGYGNGPVTPLGRVVAALIMLVGIACFGVLTATISTFFVRRTRTTQEVQEVSTSALMATLEDIRARLERLERQATARAPGEVASPPAFASNDPNGGSDAAEATG